MQAASCNMLNLALSQPDLSVRAKSALAEERSLVPSLMALLDHSLPLLRAKGVVSILLLCRWAGMGERSAGMRLVAMSLALRRRL